MSRLDLVIAGTLVAVQLDGAMAALQSQLRDIFRGFLAPAGSAAVRLIVSYDHRTAFNQFAANPALITQTEDSVPLLRRVAELYPFDRPLVIGFRNGILAYRVGAQEALLYLFRSEERNILVGSLLKLLFLFLAVVMVERDRLMVHGAGLRLGSEGTLFLGVSGAGKSTVAGYAARNDLLSDDAPMITRNGRSFAIHASPFSQVDLFDRKAADHHRREAPLTRLVFLRQADRLALEPRDKRSVVAELLREHIHGIAVMGGELRGRAFAFCCDLCAAVPGFDLFFQNDAHFLTLFEGQDSRTEP